MLPRTTRRAVAMAAAVVPAAAVPDDCVATGFRSLSVPGAASAASRRTRPCRRPRCARPSRAGGPWRVRGMDAAVWRQPWMPQRSRAAVLGRGRGLKARARGPLAVALIVTGYGLRLVGLRASPSLSTRAEPCATPRRSSCVELRRSGQGCEGGAAEVADAAADGTCSAAHAWCVFCRDGCDPRGAGRCRQWQRSAATC